MPIRRERSTEVVFYGKRGSPLSPAATACAEKLFSAAESLLPANAENLFGPWCIADVDLALMLSKQWDGRPHPIAASRCARVGVSVTTRSGRSVHHADYDSRPRSGQERLPGSRREP